MQASTAAVSGAVLSNCARNLSNNNQAEAGSTGSASDSNTLYIYTWANYIDDELRQAFQDKTGTAVTVDIYDSNETMLAKLEAGGGSAYSIVYPSDYAVSQMVESNLVMKLDQSRLNGLDNLGNKWQNPAYDPNNQYSVPTTWGTTGFIYDPEKLGTELQGWDYLYDNQAALARQITLLNDVREVMGATLKYLGYSLNSTNPDEIQEAYETLVELKPAIAAFLTNGWEDQLASGDLSVAMAYSADALNLIAEAPNLTYVVPESGASLWTDTMAIPATAPNVDAAYEWINFILEPENSAGLAERLKFATPNQAAVNLLPTDLKNNKNLFPPEAVIEKSEEIVTVPPEIADLYDRYWTQLTSA
ncbi:MAG: ABC transporter substrate-binding protein [Elainellaceae cyanobacterium]